jgi:hypothetical protein
MVFLTRFHGERGVRPNRAPLTSADLLDLIHHVQFPISHCRVVPDEIRGTATRHSSAWRFCAEHKAIAFVGSQDGELTVLAPGSKELPDVCRDIDPGVTWPQR